MAIELIKISEFPESVDTKDWFVVGDVNGVSYKLSKDNLEAELGINALMQFGGAIAPASTPEPTGDLFWIATEEGTYTNFGGVVVPAASMAVISRVDGVFTSSITTIPQPENKIDNWIAGEYFEGDQRIHNGQIWSVDVPSTTEEPGTGDDWVADIDLIEKKAIGINEFNIGDINVIEYLYGTDRNDSSIWRVGYLTSTGGHGSSPSWRYLQDPIPIAQGKYEANFYLEGNAAAVVFDKDMNVVNSYLIKGTVSGTNKWHIDVPADGYFNFSYLKSFDDYPERTLEIRYATNLTKINEVTGDVFVLSSTIEEKIDAGAQNVLAKYNIKPTPVGTNFIPNLTGSDINDRAIWGMGRLDENNQVIPEVNFYHTIDSYPLPAGTFEMYAFFRGTAKGIILEEDGVTIRQVLSSSSAGDGHFQTLELATPARIRFSHRESVSGTGRTDDIYIKNTVEVYEEITVEAKPTVERGDASPVSGGAIPVYIKDILSKSSEPRKKKPIMTIISDDGHKADLEWLKDELDITGTKITHAIVKFWTEEANAGTNPDRLTSAQIRDLWLAGDDIANHTVSHLRLNEMTLEEAESEVLDCKLFLENIIDTPVDMFVSPFGIRSANLDKIISKYHKANFISGYNEGRNPTPIDSFFMNRVSFDSPEATGELRFDTVLKPAIDRAFANSEWVIFAVHSGYSQYNPSNPVYLERRGEMSQMIAYAQSLGIEVMTAKKAYEYWKNPIEIGVKRADERYYRLGMDGSEENAGLF